MDYENITYEGKDYILRNKDLFKTLESTERCGFIDNYKVILLDSAEVEVDTKTMDYDGVFASYNGVVVQFMGIPQIAEKGATDFITKSLEQGVSLTAQIGIHLQNMKELEKSIVKEFGRKDGKTLAPLRHLNRLWGDKFEVNLRKWYFGIIILIKLKAIKADENNGLRYVSVKEEDKVKLKCLLDICVVCGKQGSWKKCSICKTDHYCGTECQKTDWKRHKATHK